MQAMITHANSRKSGVYQQELATEYQLRLKTEYVATQKRLFCCLNHYELMHLQNEGLCHLPPLDHEFLETFFLQLCKNGRRRPRCVK